MRHGIGYRKLNKTSEHRKALFKNMLNSLIKYEQIITTLPKAKELKPQIDKVITIGKKNILSNRKTYEFNQYFNLPNIILNKKDIYYYEENQASPTFITNKIISSKFSTESLESLSTFLLISNVSSTRFFIKLLKSSRLKINSLLSIPIFSKFTKNSEFFERWYLIFLE